MPAFGAPMLSGEGLEVYQALGFMATANEAGRSPFPCQNWSLLKKDEHGDSMLAEAKRILQTALAG
jgi:hypothetical protein